MRPVTTDSITRIIAGLPKRWQEFLGDWDRSLRAGNYPETTRYIYVLAAAQLARYLGEYSPDPEAVAAAADPVEVSRAHVEAFQAWMIQTRSAATALNKHKGLRQFFRWLRDDEQEIARSPMERVRQPKTPQKLIPIIGDEDTAKVLATCVGKGFIALRDEAIIRLLYNTGARLSEVAGLRVSDVDLGTDSVCYHGKGSKDRRVRFGPKTGRALSRYLRARAKHKGAGLGELWLAERGARRLAPNGIKIMLRRRGLAAGLPDVHAHRWRHNYAHEWKRAGGDTGDLMLLLGWTSEDMPRHYGASAAAQRAQQTQLRLGIGEMSNHSDHPAAKLHKRNVTGMTAQQRSHRARIAAHASWAKTSDRAARTSRGTQAFLERFERQVDPQGKFPAEIRQQMARHARTAYMLQLAQRSAQARQQKSRDTHRSRGLASE